MKNNVIWLLCKFSFRSDYCTVDGAGIVPHKVTKYRRTKAFRSVVMVDSGQGKRREDLRVIIRVSVVIKQKFHLSSHITSLYPSTTTWRSGPIAFPLAATVDGAVVSSIPGKR